MLPKEGKTYQPEGVFKLGHSLPGLELAVLQVTQGVLKSPLAEARGQVSQTHEVAALVGCRHRGPRLRGCQLSYKRRWDHSVREAPQRLGLGLEDDKPPLGAGTQPLLFSPCSSALMGQKISPSCSGLSWSVAKSMAPS